MNKDQAIEQLGDAEVVPCLTAGVGDAKEILGACLEKDIPAVLSRPESCGQGCATKLELCVRPDDVPKVMALLHSRWQALLDREGTLCEENQEEGHGDPPCPACGVAGPLHEGACGECGLQLE